jgi:cytochrome c5
MNMTPRLLPVAALALLVFPATCPAETTPEAIGENLLETRCSVCHTSDRPKGAKKTRTEWEKTVTKMMGKGAKLTPAEKIALVDYLAKTYKP